MKFFVTKYALTAGIEEVEGATSETHPSMLVVKKGTSPQYFHGEGKEWHRTLETAKQRAENLRLAKIKSLKESIKKMERLVF